MCSCSDFGEAFLVVGGVLSIMYIPEMALVLVTDGLNLMMPSNLHSRFF